MYNLVLIPEGSQQALPEDIAHLYRTEADLIAKIYAGRESEVMVSVNTRELQLLVEYRDMLPIHLRAVIGLPGAMYNSVWNTYVATLDRITTDTLRSELQEQNARGARDGIREITRPSRITRIERATKAADSENPTHDEPGLDG